MRRLVRVLIQLVFGVVCFVGMTALFVVFDGLNDIGDTADAALVSGQEGEGVSEDSTTPPPGLVRAARLYKDGAVPRIIVTSGQELTASDIGRHLGVEGTTVYLEKLGVPASAIIEDTGAKDTEEMARDVAAILQVRDLGSVMIVTDYYRMTRIKLALLHAGVENIAKSHVGHAGITDAWPIACEVAAIYDLIFETYLRPTAEKVKQEASDAADKARAQAGKAKDGVDKSLDSLPK